MGINGLHEFFEERGLLHQINVFDHRAYKGKRIAIDGNGWLHRFKGDRALAHLLFLVEWCGEKGHYGHVATLVPKLCERLAAFKNAGITPVLVFDGLPLPLKAPVLAERHK